MFDELAGEQESFREKIADFFFKRPSNPKNLKLLGVTFLIFMMVAGVAILAQGPLFHSPEKNPAYNPDPNTLITNYVGPSGTLNEFNFIKATNGATSLSGCSFCHGIALAPNSGITAVALSQNPIGDLGAISGKELYIAWMWAYVSGSCCGTTGQRWGVYFTRNATLPTQANYDPFQDSSVALIISAESNGTATTTLNSIYIQRQQLNSISSEFSSSCVPASACFIQSLLTISGNPTSQIFNLESYLNETGNGENHPCTNGFFPYGGSGCSVLSVSDANQGLAKAVSFLPSLPFQGQQYYMGFYADRNLPFVPIILFDSSLPCSCRTGVVISAEVSVATPQTNAIAVVPPPTIDTGGFFGPIIKGLIAIGVFIVQNIILFLNFLATVLWPVLAGVFTILANALKLVLNSLGSFFGLGNIGDSIISFFTGIFAWLSNIVVSAFGQITNLVNLLLQLLTWLGSVFGGPIWTGIIGIATLLASGWATIVTAYGFLTQLSTNGLLGINYYFLVDWIFGMFMLSTKGMEGFKTWIDLNGLVFSKIAMAMFFFVKESIQALVWIKQIVVNWV
jgi:hypothetical protein